MLELAADVGLPVLTVPSARELSDGRTQVNCVREVEPEDVLGREPIHLDEAGIEAGIRGKTVFVTGAGGSIGSELCRQVARYGPACLVLFELNEFNLYQIEQEFAERWPQLPVVRLIGDVRTRADAPGARPVAAAGGVPRRGLQARAADGAGERLCLRAQQHAGTWHWRAAAAECGVERFVLISTDKAVNPTNVMGPPSAPRRW